MTTSSKMKKYILTVAILILLRISDLFITFLYTPHLAEEWNPLVAKLGGGWTTLILAQVIIIGLISFLAYFYFFRKKNQDLPSYLSFHDYIYLFYFEKISKNLKEMKSNRPRLNTGILGHNGFVLIVVAIAFSIYAIINNLLIISGHDAYSEFVFKYGNYLYPILIAVFFFIAFYWFFFMEYREYQNDERRRLLPPK